MKAEFKDEKPVTSRKGISCSSLQMIFRNELVLFQPRFFFDLCSEVTFRPSCFNSSSSSFPIGDVFLVVKLVSAKGS